LQPESVSVIIVNYKVADLLLQAVRSIFESSSSSACEVIVVDNNSQDNSRQLLANNFPQVQFIGLKNNIGFGKACNIGAREARGDFLLFLNPDTVVSHDTIDFCRTFLQTNPRAGLVGPRILNQDGTLQKSCRRGFPTPVSAFAHFSGLSRCFPKSRLLGSYHLSYLDESQPSIVDAISGSFLFLRKETFQHISGFDEQFFMYGEDIDLCKRIHDRGLEVWYRPEVSIIHFKARSSRQRKLQTRLAFYEAMILFSKKYQKRRGGFFPFWLIHFAISIQALITIGGVVVRSAHAVLTDFVIINAALMISIWLRFLPEQSQNPYLHFPLSSILPLHILASASFLLVFINAGIYSTHAYHFKRILAACFLSSILFVSGVYFVQTIAYSRIAFFSSVVIATSGVLLWRSIILRSRQGLRRKQFAGRIAVVGNGNIADRLIEQIAQSKNAQLAAILWPDNKNIPAHYRGYPVFGSLDDLASVLHTHKLHYVIIATDAPWYSSIIEALAEHKGSKTNFKWVPKELFNLQPHKLPDTIPLQDISV